MSVCRSAAEAIKVKDTISTFEGVDSADFGKVDERSVVRPDPNVPDAVGVAQRAIMLEPVAGLALHNDVSDRAYAADVVEGVGKPLLLKAEAGAV